MTWTYSGDPSDSPGDAVRFEIQDTNEAGALLSDEEIAYALAQEATVLAAAARCCEALARQFASKADLTIASGDDTVKRSFGSMASSYAAQAVALRARATTGAPWHGGGSRSRKDDLLADMDRVQPSFRRGEFDKPGSGLA